MQNTHFGFASHDEEVEDVIFHVLQCVVVAILGIEALHQQPGQGERVLRHIVVSEDAAVEPLVQF